MNEVIVILHNIRSTHNVGSIFRTADAAGVTKMYLTGYTPKPIDRFGRPQKDIAKTALGGQEYVRWESGDINNVLKDLKKEGFSIISIEQDERSIVLNDFKTLPKMALILGNEVRGVSKQLRDKSDYIVEIPMHGKKESLNVSVTAGIVLFSLSTNT
ncbi:TrmH family RNA methyltransferase [Candidatus Kaiserbacteria bacterium]|nr:MAG: TrmH family RNA methyltransferase [Candidatus Kaiserbacteria bacterium]